MSKRALAVAVERAARDLRSRLPSNATVTIVVRFPDAAEATYGVTTNDNPAEVAEVLRVEALALSPKAHGEVLH